MLYLRRVYLPLRVVLGFCGICCIQAWRYRSEDSTTLHLEVALEVLIVLLCCASLALCPL